MSRWREYGIAIVRILLGIVALVGGLFVLDLVVYISSISSSYSAQIAAAYDAGHTKGYADTYYRAYHKAYPEAYDRGYKKGYEIGLRAGSQQRVATRVELRNPTYNELREFLARDKTDDNMYITDKYVSFDFAVDLNNNAELEGMRAAFVTVIFPEKSHGIVAFETADKGLIFIEPQSDAEVNVAIGKSYWRSAGGISPVYYDDTVVELQILW